MLVCHLAPRMSQSVMAGNRNKEGGIREIPSVALRGVTFWNKEASYESSSVCDGETDRGQILPAKLNAHVGWGHLRMIHSCPHRKTGTHAHVQTHMHTHTHALYDRFSISVTCVIPGGTI